MEVIAKIVQPMLAMGAAVFLPIVFFILGLIVHMKPSRASSAGITLGVAFAGIGLVMNFLTTNVGEAAKAFVTSSGFTLKALDMGWPAMLGFTWQWSYTFLMFPIQIGINIVMILFGWTKTLNVDMWNVVNKIFTVIDTTETSTN